MVERGKASNLIIFATISLCLLLFIFAVLQRNGQVSYIVEENILIEEQFANKSFFENGMEIFLTSRLEGNMKELSKSGFTEVANDDFNEVKESDIGILLERDGSEKSLLQYCIALLYEEYNLPIAYQTIYAFDEVLEGAAPTHHNITLPMILKTYGAQIFTVILIVMGLLLYSVIMNVRINNKLRLQNMKYEVLSIISNEYLYEYNLKEKRLLLSEKCRQLFSDYEEYSFAKMKIMEHLSKRDYEKGNQIIRLPLGDGKIGVFKIINSRIYDKNGKTDSIIGKLIDISEETAEKEQLLVKSQVDGLTTLYNAETTKELIVKKLMKKTYGERDALILIDCDNFKEINDNYGHLVGNHVLEHLGICLKQTFTNDERAIIGRFGGDEFCVYVEKVPSVQWIKEKCEELIVQIHTIKNVELSVSVGVSFVNRREPYERVFKKADDALYQAKRTGKARVYIYNEYE